MSFDVFLQGFRHGDAADGDGDAALGILEPLLSERNGNWGRIVTADGEADVYGLESLQTGMMINHASGLLVWDILVELARAARFVIMPVGCPTLVPTSDMVVDLPPVLASHAVVVASGAEARRAIEQS